MVASKLVFVSMLKFKATSGRFMLGHHLAGPIYSNEDSLCLWEAAELNELQRLSTPEGSRRSNPPVSVALLMIQRNMSWSSNR